MCTTTNSENSNTGNTIPDCSSSGVNSNTRTGVASSGCYFIHNDSSEQYPESLVTLLNSENMDSYTAGIELSNACREFYVKRQKDAESLKSKLSTTSQQKQSEESNYSSPLKPKPSEGKSETGTLQPKLDLLKEQLVSFLFSF